MRIVLRHARVRVGVGARVVRRVVRVVHLVGPGRMWRVVHPVVGMSVGVRMVVFVRVLVTAVADRTRPRRRLARWRRGAGDDARQSRQCEVCRRSVCAGGC